MKHFHAFGSYYLSRSDVMFLPSSLLWPWPPSLKRHLVVDSIEAVSQLWPRLIYLLTPPVVCNHLLYRVLPYPLEVEVGDCRLLYGVYAQIALPPVTDHPISSHMSIAP